MFLSRGFVSARRSIAVSCSSYCDKKKKIGKRLPGVRDEKSLKEALKVEWDSLQRVPPHMPDHEVPLRCPRHTDALIIGGGIIGNAIAYFLRTYSKREDSYTVTIVEREPSYKECSTTLSIGGIRQQFSLPENILASKFSAEFIRNLDENLGVVGCDPPDIGFQPGGYLLLASEEGAEQLIANHKTQTELGCKVKLFSPQQLQERYPWIATEGVALGSLGLENEGWFDPWSLLNAFKIRNQSTEVRYVHGELIEINKFQDFQFGGPEKLDSAEILLLDNDKGDVQNVQFSVIFNAAGPWAANVAKMAGIGLEDDERSWTLRHALPVEPRKRYVFVFHCPDGPGLEMPLVVDNSGVYCRREGFAGHYLCGMSPLEEDEPDCGSGGGGLEVDHKYFDEKIWPLLAHRIPAFNNIKVTSSWAGYYDYNYLDQNVILGPHPHWDNFYFCNGLSGHGIQMAPAVARAVVEQKFHERFKSIDFNRFHFDRLLHDMPIFEANII